MEYGRRYVKLLAPLVEAGDSAADALTLFERRADLTAFDALLAATAIANDVEALVSADTAFADVPALRHVLSGTPAFEGPARFLAGAQRA